MNSLRNAFQGQHDFEMESIVLHNETVQLYYLSTLVDKQWFDTQLDRLDLMQEKTIGLEQAIEDILAGKVVCALKKNGAHYSFMPKQASTERSIMPPQAENVILSAYDAFTENQQTNIALLRRKIKTLSLQVRTYQKSYAFQKHKIAILHYPSAQSNDFIQQLMSLLENHRGNGFPTLQSFLKLLGNQWYLPISAINTSELPGEAIQAMEHGKVVCFLDDYPFALILPGILSDVWRLKEDYNFPASITWGLQFFRMIAIFISVTAPAAYIALTSVNPEFLRLQLALSIAKTRENVPYPAVIEILIMLLVIDLIVEASIRLPKSIGPTVTMVGGIILGEAAVQAQLVSNLLIITIAITTISNYAVTRFQHALAIRMYRYFLLIAASVYGIVGIWVGVLWFVMYFGSIKTLGIPYATWTLKKGD